uniref:Uncharacterized protein n=1 Tax=Heterosigma akashiwo TaxID=2829 RepID=A0A7S3YAA8_HETAK
MSPAGMLQYEGGIFDFGKALLNDAFPAESPAEKKKTLLRNHSSPAILSPVNEAASAGHKFFDFDSSKEGQERQKETHQLRTPAKKNNGGQSLYFSTPGGPNITGGSSLVQASVPSSPGHQLRTPVMRKSLSSSPHPTTSKKLLPVSKSQDYEQYGSTKGGAPSLELPHSRTPSSKVAGSVPGAGAAPTGGQSNMEVLIAQLKTDTDGEIDGMLWKRAPAASAAAGRL